MKLLAADAKFADPGSKVLEAFVRSAKVPLDGLFTGRRFPGMPSSIWQSTLQTCSLGSRARTSFLWWAGAGFCPLARSLSSFWSFCLLCFARLSPDAGRSVLDRPAPM